ncbi:MAG: aminoacyl-tRNA hydrolase [Alphaproteobacteria bacterium]|nr:aminoacyl-tRNA hydrolase [Alphaproteobacteria bacterium]
MASPSRLIIGLGNHGEEYARTRHNIGFMAVDAIAARYGCPAWKKKFRGFVTSSAEGANAFLLLKPQTYMNLSGESAVEAMNFYQLKLEQVVVFHDDLDLLPGQVKIKQGGGSGGHNGLKSLDTHIGQDYWRVRIGIGRPVTEQGEPVKGDAVTNYVLNPFAKADRAWVEPLLDAIAGEFDLLLAGDYAAYAMKLPKA